MNNDGMPLVTVGIPTFNRERLIERAVASVLAQDHPHLEIVISDNCSTDSTSAICQRLADHNPRIRYIRQPSNIGPTRNFEAVLEQASGQYFMWLGDDDHIDHNYISATLSRLKSDPALALAAGVVRYYRDGSLVDTGRKFDVSAATWWGRVAQYYWNVSDNGVFYGLMRTPVIRATRFKNVFGGDWLTIAGVAASGRIVMTSETTVHRELGGASQTHAHTARVLGLGRLHAVFPYLSIAANGYADIATQGSFYKRFGFVPRRLAAAMVFMVLLTRAITASSAELLVQARNGIRRRLGAT